MLRRPSAALASAALAFALLASTVACGDDDGGDASSTTTAAAAGAITVPPKDDGCFTLTPGEIYSAEQALVVLKPQSVCPSFLTLRAGTELRFRNDDTVPHTVQVERGSTPKTATQIAEQELAPGTTWSFRFGDPDTYLFTTDVLATFLGVVEVRAAS